MKVNPRIIELCERLTAPGHCSSNLSASEFHELADFIFDLDDATEDAIDIHAELKKQQKIAAIWVTDDVKEVRPDLTEDQCWEVLQKVDHKHDAAQGINWMVLEFWANDMFPRKKT